MTIMTCGRCGADVPGAEAAAVEALTVAGTRLCSVLCPDCVRVMAAGKYPGVFMTSDGKLEAIPSVPAEANTCAPKVVGEFGYAPELTQNRPYLKKEVDALCAAQEQHMAEFVSSLEVEEKANTCSPEVPCCEACAEFEAEMAAELARDQARKAAREDRTREALADYAHEAWAGWMRNQAALQLQMERKGTTVITWIAAEDYDRWARQMRTPYAELPEVEKASDRVQADRILAILRGEG